MATIKDVAKLAGVSVATVSNILNHKTYVSNEKYKKVMDAIEELNYNPSFLASNLRSRRTKNVAVVLPELNLTYGQILDGIQQVMEKQGYSIIIKITKYNRYLENVILEEALNLGVSGILAVPVSMDNGKKYQSIQAKGIPVVSLCNEVCGGDVSCVAFDNRKLVFELTDRLMKGRQEKKAPILLTGSPERSENRDCIQGFEEAMEKHGASGEHYNVHCLKERCFVELIDLLNGMEEIPPCFITSCSNIADSLLQALKQLKKKADIHSLDGDSVYASEKKHIVDIHRNTMKLGEDGASLLLEYIQSPVFFENRREMVRSAAEYEENLNWPPAPERKTIRLLLIDGEATRAMLKTVGSFTAQYNIDIQYDYMEHHELYREILESNARHDGRYDVIMVDYPWLSQFCNDDFLLDMQPYIDQDRDEYVDGFFSIAQEEFIHYREKTYVIPFWVTMQFLFYRRDLFEANDLKWRFYKKYGVELCLPKTWTEFDVIAQFFTKEFNPDSPTKYGTSFEKLAPISLGEQFFPRQWSCKGSIISPKGVVVCDSAENRRALMSLKNAYKCSNYLEEGYGTNAGSILGGDVAMCVTYATHIPSAIRSSGQNVDYSNILTTKIPGNCPLFGGWSAGINRYSSNAFESYMFIKWATCNQNAISSTLLGGFVPKKLLSENTHVYNIYPWMKDIQTEFTHACKRRTMENNNGKSIDSSTIDFTLSKSLVPFLQDELTVEQTLQELQESFEILNKS